MNQEETDIDLILSYAFENSLDSNSQAKFPSNPKPNIRNIKHLSSS